MYDSSAPQPTNAQVQVLTFCTNALTHLLHFSPTLVTEEKSLLPLVKQDHIKLKHASGYCLLVHIHFFQCIQHISSVGVMDKLFSFICNKTSSPGASEAGQP